MENLHIYEAVRTVPKEAQKTISGGRLNGKTDINPMWRLKTLTEQFGPCGVGWKYSIEKQWLEVHGEETAAFVNILLYFKHEGAWSEGIPGTGGSMFAEKERNGIHVSDECFKMALTDAISVACKAMGMGADIYWGADATKYDRAVMETQKQPATAAQRQQIFSAGQKLGYSVPEIEQFAIGAYKHGVQDLTVDEAEHMVTKLGNTKPKEVA